MMCIGAFEVAQTLNQTPKRKWK